MIGLRVAGREVWPGEEGGGYVDHRSAKIVKWGGIEKNDIVVGKIEWSIFSMDDMLNDGLDPLLTIDTCCQACHEASIFHEALVKKDILWDIGGQVVVIHALEVRRKERGHNFGLMAIRMLSYVAPFSSCSAVILKACPLHCVGWGKERIEAASKKLQCYYGKLGFDMMRGHEWMFLDPADEKSAFWASLDRSA